MTASNEQLSKLAICITNLEINYTKENVLEQKMYLEIKKHCPNKKQKLKKMSELLKCSKALATAALRCLKKLLSFMSKENDAHKCTIFSRMYFILTDRKDKIQKLISRNVIRLTNGFIKK